MKGGKKRTTGEGIKRERVYRKRDDERKRERGGVGKQKGGEKGVGGDNANIEWRQERAGNREWRLERGYNANMEWVRGEDEKGEGNSGG